MRDEFKRIRDDAATLVQFLDEYLLIKAERNDETETRWMIQAIDRFRSNIGEALGRIEAAMGQSNASQGSQVPTKQNTPPRDCDEFLSRQFPHLTTSRSGVDDVRQSGEEIIETTKDEKKQIVSDPDYGF
jgi:hypothetical protein